MLNHGRDRKHDSRDIDLHEELLHIEAPLPAIFHVHCPRYVGWEVHNVYKAVGHAAIRHRCTLVKQRMHIADDHEAKAPQTLGTPDPQPPLPPPCHTTALHLTYID
jgi:hypothetical protein